MPTCRPPGRDARHNGSADDGRRAGTGPERDPAKPVRIVVGYPAGGGNDVIVRIVAQKLSDNLGQPVVIDNKPGAASIIAAEHVAKSATDGYTLLMGPSGPLVFNPALYPKLPYSPTKDFAPIGLIGAFPLMLVVNAAGPDQVCEGTD